MESRGVRLSVDNVVLGVSQLEHLAVSTGPKTVRDRLSVVENLYVDTSFSS